MLRCKNQSIGKATARDQQQGDRQGAVGGQPGGSLGGAASGAADDGGDRSVRSCSWQVHPLPHQPLTQQQPHQQGEAEPGIGQGNHLDGHFGLGGAAGSRPAMSALPSGRKLLPPVSAAMACCRSTLRTARCRSTGVPVTWNVHPTACR